MAKLSDREKQQVKYLCRLEPAHRERLLEEPDQVQWTDGVKEACRKFDEEVELEE